MRVKFVLVSALLIFSLSTAASAGPNWVEEFLHRYHSTPLTPAKASRFVLEDQVTVATDQTALLQSAVGFANALVDLEQAMGLTLSKNNVQLDQAFKAGGVDPTSPVYSSSRFNLLKNR